MQTMSAPCAKAEIPGDLRPLARRRRMVGHSSIHWGRMGTRRERLQCFTILICKRQIVTELAVLKPETVVLQRGGRAGMKSLPFREKKGGGVGGERTCKVDYTSLFKGFFCLQNGSFEEGKSWVFKSLVKDQ